MTRQSIKRILLFVCMAVLVFSTQSKAQDADNNHFIYIQAKAKQPFYVILNKKVYSSSSIGYLIIPKLKDGSYDLRIGFPQAQAPEQNFTCVVKGSDAGYSLEKGEDGNLGLLNLQSKKFIASNSQTTLEDQYAAANPQPDKAAEKITQEKDAAKAETKEATASNNAFSEMLSNAAGDPTLGAPIPAPKAVLANKGEKKSTQVEDFGKDPEADSKAIAEAAPEENLKPAEEATADFSKTFGVIKSGQERSRKGTEMTFVMFNSRSTDTVKILVPRSAATEEEEKTTGVAPTPISKKESLALFANTEEDSFTVDNQNALSERREERKRKREEKRFVDIGNSDQAKEAEGDVKGAIDNPFYSKSKDDAGQTISADTEKKEDTDVTANDEQAAEVVQCDPITDKNFQKMQKKMIARNNDNDMIAIVDKYIAGKCLTTSQVKTLGGLFLSDAGRYALYHDTYSHVTDKQNFPSLEGQLLDSYFKKRFQQILQ
ncbi:DUF4476 domain-containing protein [Arachidicoccus terrestris]|uniref:DUF4476 domain-containing protein n=1 Tax=Arachidicoccus terrestris TaxID=2875539 RepID=UPI001CC755CE|nr:DUF4476 domain-containing protein [Arachidicoccus terrestris]UAY56683.1 DUF4476 domain-containing protein [Arachidicoccus terrestris]